MTTDNPTAAHRPAQPARVPAQRSNETKAAFKTTEFIAYVVAVISVLLASFLVSTTDAHEDYFRAAHVGSRRGLHLTTVATCGFRCCLTPLADGSVSRTASFPTTSATWQPSDPGDLAQCDCGAIGTEKMSIKIESRW